MRQRKALPSPKRAKGVSHKKPLGDAFFLVVSLEVFGRL